MTSAPIVNSSAMGGLAAPLLSTRPQLPTTPVASISAISAQQQQLQLQNNQQIISREIKPGKSNSNNSYSVTGDEDINDVAAMGGVNLAEESQRMQATSGISGTQLIRSCGKDETFLQTGLLHKRISKICLENGLDEPSSELIALGKNMEF